MRVVVMRAKDTTRFELPARANRCGGLAADILLQGARDGNGVAVWLRSPDSIASGAWPVLQRGDTLSSRGAVVGVRFMVGDGVHGVAIDSGAVTVTRRGGTITVLVRGTGFETVMTGRVGVDLTFGTVPVASDTMSCRRRL